MIPNRVIIAASGASMRQKLWKMSIPDLPLWDKLLNEFVISVNWTYKWAHPTVAFYGDYRFYVTEKEGLDKLPLVVGKQDSFYIERYKKYISNLGSNLYFIKPCQGNNPDGKGMRDWYWGSESWQKGFYCPQLSGIMALNFAIALGCTEIYLLGYDCQEINGRTHFYQGDDEHTGLLKFNEHEYSGIGKNSQGEYNTGTYNQDANRWFEPFAQELKRVQIYNVSPESKLNVFPKLTYDQFFKTIQEFPKTIQQVDLIHTIIQKLKENS